MTTTTAPAAKTTRIYAVLGMDGAPIALVEATNSHAASRYWLNKNAKIEFAGQALLFAAFKAGLSVERADESEDSAS